MEINLIKETLELTPTQLRNLRKKVHFELIHLKREVDKTYLTYNSNLLCYESLRRKFYYLDSQLAELDGRKEICPEVKECKKKGKKEKTNVQELIKQLSDFDRKRLVQDLRALNVPLIK